MTSYKISIIVRDTDADPSSLLDRTQFALTQGLEGVLLEDDGGEFDENDVCVEEVPRA